MLTNYAKAVLKSRWTILVLTLLSTALIGYGGKNLIFTSDYRVFFSQENPQLAAFEDLQDTYTKNDNVMFMLLPDSGNVFDKKTLAAIIELTEQAWQIPYSIRVDSITNFQHTYSADDDLFVVDLVEQPEQLSAAQIAAIKQVAINEPLLVNNLVSPDATATAVNITIEFPGVNETVEVPEVATFVRHIRDQFVTQHADIKIYMTGIAEINYAFASHAQNDIAKLVPLAFLVIMLGVLLFTRSISGTIGTALIVIFSVISAMGAAGWIGIKLTGASVSAPTMILTLAVADSIHFLVSMLYLMRHGSDKNSGIIESLRINFSPIFLTSLTTVIGFLSLNFSDSPPFRDLGNITAMGVGFAFIYSVTFLPAFMSACKLKTRSTKNKGRHQIDYVADFVISNRTRLLWLIGALSLFFIAMVPKNELNDVFVEYFDQTIEFRRHTDAVTKHLTGMYSIDFSIDSKQSGGISAPQYLQQLESFGVWLRQQPEVLHVNILTDILKRLNKNLHGDQDDWHKLPGQRDLAAQYLLLYEMSLPLGLDLNNQINIDKSSTRVSVRLKTLSTNEVLSFEQRISTWFDANAAAIKTAGASPMVMFSHIGKRNIRSMLIGTSVALVLISLILVLALRSLRIGVISLLPNLLPMGIAFGIWGLWVGEIGLGLSVVAGMTLGIVVDDTVHFLSKYLRARRERDMDSTDAVRYAFATVGVALSVNTLVLVAGFLVLATSHFRINSDMGLMTAITITIALAVDFLLLPPILMKYDTNKSVN